MRKYIEARYPQPIILSVSNYLGSVIFSYLDKHDSATNSIIRSSPDVTAQRYRGLNDAIEVKIAKYLIFKQITGLHLSPAKAILVNNLFEEKIAEDLHTYCTVYEKAGFTRKNAMKEFCQDHKIEFEIDVNYDTLKQAAYRHKKSLEKSSKDSSADLSRPFF